MSKQAVRPGDMPAHMAVRMILRRLFEPMEANESGLLNDPDSLHDFRVALRRTRCALKQLGKALPPEPVGHFLSEFAWLGSVTGAARDLDVYLLNLDAYEAALPQHLKGGLEPLRMLVAEKLKQEKRMLAGQFRSARYKALKRDWRAFLDQTPSDGASAAGGVPVMELAHRRIGRMFRRVLKEGRAIRRHSPPEALHVLRKSCKKLRYLLEFFRRLYDGDEIRTIIRALKRLQNNLGELQDLAVQLSALHAFHEELAAEGCLSGVSHEAMEVLAHHLQQRHDAAHMAFSGQFRRFASAKNRHRFQRLLEGGRA